VEKNKEQFMMAKPILIIQTSPVRTGSTVLTNVLYGLLAHSMPVKGFWQWTDVPVFSGNVTIWKSHLLDIDRLAARFSTSHQVYFVCSERGELKMPPHSYSGGVILVQYAVLAQTSPEDVVDCILARLRNRLPPNLPLSRENAVRRLKEMNKRYESIRDKPFDYIDPFYELHGSHRNRDLVIPR
jgi:hypothetical protein